jgi:hypothetical protein
MKPGDAAAYLSISPHTHPENLPAEMPVLIGNISGKIYILVESLN